jgi:hypothetical protein
MTVAILIPAMRGHLLPALVENIHAATPEEHEILVVGTRAVVRPILTLDDDRLRVWIDRGGTWGCRLNYLYGQSTAPYVFCGADDIQFTEGWLSEALKPMRRVDGGTWGGRLNKLFGCTTEPYLFLGADDVRFHPGWLDAAIATMEQVDGVVAVNDLWNPRGTLALVSRRYLLEEGGTVDDSGAIIHEGYRHCYSETELFETAQSRGRFAYCAEAVVEHLHPAAGKAVDDAVYQLGTAAFEADQALYLSRRHLWA